MSHLTALKQRARQLNADASSVEQMPDDAQAVALADALAERLAELPTPSTPGTRGMLLTILSDPRALLACNQLQRRLAHLADVGRDELQRRDIFI